MVWNAEEIYYRDLPDAAFAAAYLAQRQIARESSGHDRTKAGNRVKLIEDVARATGRLPVLVAAVQAERADKEQVKCACGYPAATRKGCPWCRFEAERKERADNKEAARAKAAGQ